MLFARATTSFLFLLVASNSILSGYAAIQVNTDRDDFGTKLGACLAVEDFDSDPITTSPVQSLTFASSSIGASVTEGESTAVDHLGVKKNGKGNHHLKLKLFTSEFASGPKEITIVLPNPTSAVGFNLQGVNANPPNVHADITINGVTYDPVVERGSGNGFIGFESDNEDITTIVFHLNANAEGVGADAFKIWKIFFASTTGACAPTSSPTTAAPTLDPTTASPTTPPTAMPTASCVVEVNMDNTAHYGGLTVGFNSPSAVLDFSNTGLDLNDVHFNQGAFTGHSISGQTITLIKPAQVTIGTPGGIGFNGNNVAALATFSAPTCVVLNP